MIRGSASKLLVRCLVAFSGHLFTQMLSKLIGANTPEVNMFGIDYIVLVMSLNYHVFKSDVQRKFNSI